jgi:tRNA modification GTPase
MSYDLDDTIAAIASPPGGGLRGIVRVSGHRARECVEPLFEPLASRVLLSDVRRATAVPGRLRLPELAGPLPCDLYVWPDGRSYTRQPMVEIHTLGSPPLLECVLANACAHGARLAEPGEFTLRAFLAGRLDLTQAEAVLGVIDAGDARQFDVALRQLAGGIAGPMTALREDLLDLLAELEAGLDFVEEDIEFISAEELESRLAAAADTVARLAEQMTSRSESREAVRVVLVGWPNVGKSSLFNALAGRDRALVSPVAGTTRDYLTAELDLDGIRVELVDTAGVDVGVQPSGCKTDCQQAAAWTPAAAAQQRAVQQAAAAAVRLLCLDSTRPLNDWERRRLAASAGDVIVLTKGDGPKAIGTELSRPVTTSARTGEGLVELRRRVREAAEASSPSDGPVIAATATRCRESLRQAAESLERAGALARTRAGEELVAAETRVALDELGKVIGAVYTDDVLDRIFSRFCIGK